MLLAGGVEPRVIEEVLGTPNDAGSRTGNLERTRV
jgi:hypothetical protein